MIDAERKPLDALDPPEWLFQALREFPMQATVAAWEAMIANGDDSSTYFHRNGSNGWRTVLILDVGPTISEVSS